MGFETLGFNMVCRFDIFDINIPIWWVTITRFSIAMLRYFRYYCFDMDRIFSIQGFPLLDSSIGIVLTFEFWPRHYNIENGNSWSSWLYWNWTSISLNTETDYTLPFSDNFHVDNNEEGYESQCRRSSNHSDCPVWQRVIYL